MSMAFACMLLAIRKYHNRTREHLRPMSSFNSLVMLGFATLAAFPFEEQAPDVRTQKWFRGVLAGWSALAGEYPYYKLKASTILAQNGISKEDFTDTDGASQRSHAQS